MTNLRQMPSLRDLSTRDTDNSIPMLLDKYKTILIVEGSSDKKFYKRLFPEVGYIKTAVGKTNVVRMMASIRTNRRRYQVYALVDKDYPSGRSGIEADMQVVCTDAQSMETMIWMTDDHSILLGILCEVMDVNVIDRAPIQQIYQRAYDTAFKIGLLRYLNNRPGWNLDFKRYQLDVSLFDENEELKLDALLPEIVDTSSTTRSIEEILDAVKEAEKQQMIPWNIMQGHDLSAAFIYHCKRNCTLFPPDRWDDMKVAVEEFESRARTAASIPNLMETNCCRTIRAWLDEYKGA